MKTSELLLLPGQQFYENEDNDEDEDDANFNNKDNGSTNDKKNTQDTDKERPHSNVKPRRTRRQAAIRAKQRIATMNRIQSITNVNKLPTHGWDYALMMELDLLDDDE